MNADKRLVLTAHPFPSWSDNALKEAFVTLYRRVIIGTSGGWLYSLALHALRDELHDRDIDPITTLTDAGIPKGDIDYRETEAAQ